MIRRPLFRLIVIPVLAGALALSGCGTPDSSASDSAASGSGAGVQLFQRPWVSIAEDCETTIGPAGFEWVLTSPPNEHIAGEQWWTSYQPVSYELESKLGTREEFADMVQRCDAVGVKIIADAVINHMAGIDGGTGVNGTEFTHYNYPGLYTEEDFHHCGLTENNDIEDYSSKEQVQNCELVNLADLDTASPKVQETIVAYLDDLLSLGVAGFRIDAAKHMPVEDVQAIVDQLPEDTIIWNEVIRGSVSEPIKPEDYIETGQVFEFQYSRDLSPMVRAGFIMDPKLDGEERPLHVPDESALVFIDNHDTERGEQSVLNYRAGARYEIANILMLADDFGTPVVYSGYAYSNTDTGARQNANGKINPSSCAGVTGIKDSYRDGEFVCTEAWTSIAGMLEWREVVGDAKRLPGMREGKVYGFEREGKGIVAVNLGYAIETLELPTSLPNGRYCDVVSGGRDALVDGECKGLDFIVSGGVAQLEFPPNTAIAFHANSRS